MSISKGKIIQQKCQNFFVQNFVQTLVHTLLVQTYLLQLVQTSTTTSTNFKTFLQKKRITICQVS